MQPFMASAILCNLVWIWKLHRHTQPDTLTCCLQRDVEHLSLIIHASNSSLMTFVMSHLRTTNLYRYTIAEYMLWLLHLIQCMVSG
jgi:hypothetical protein